MLSSVSIVGKDTLGNEEDLRTERVRKEKKNKSSSKKKKRKVLLHCKSPEAKVECKTKACQAVCQACVSVHMASLTNAWHHT